jgi:hypothetical protein
MTRKRYIPAVVAALVLLVPLLLAASQAEQPTDLEIPLERHLRILIRPTLMGLVPPADSEGYGEVFIRVLEVEGDSLEARYEIKERIARATSPADSMRIRRGQVHVAGLDTGPGVSPPLFWPDGDWTVADGLIWLPRADYRELVDDGSCSWRINSSSTDEDQAGSELQEYLESLGTAEDTATGTEFRLQLSAGDRYPCWVNGERTDLPAQHAVDNLGLAEYWILADEANPLLLKMSFTPAERDGPADERGGGELSLLEAGAGYAVVEIDY